MLGLLTFTIFNFFDGNIFRGIIFRKEFSLFSKIVQSTNSPFSVSLLSLTRNPALNFWCSVSRHIKIEIETVEWIKSRIWEKKESKYSKTLANIRVTAVFLKRDMRITFLTQIYRDFYKDVRMLALRAFHKLIETSKKVPPNFSISCSKKS